MVKIYIIFAYLFVSKFHPSIFYYVLLEESFVSNFNYSSVLIQASSEHPLAKAILQYARHFHFFDESSPTSDTKSASEDYKSGWLYDVSDFSALPGRGIQCFIDGRRILVMSFGYCDTTYSV